MAQPSWQSMFPVQEEWPSPQFAGDEDSPPPARNTGKGSLDFGSFIIRDALVDRVPISRPASRASSAAGTLVVKEGSGSLINKQGENEGLAWAAALMGNKDLLAGQEDANSVKTTDGNSLPTAGANQRVSSSPFKLLSIFEPPPTRGKTRASSALEPLPEETSTDVEKQSEVQERQQSDAEQLQRNFTFSFPRERTSWKNMPHFLGSKQPEVSVAVSPNVSPREPFSNRAPGSIGQNARTSSASSSANSQSSSPLPKQSGFAPSTPRQATGPATASDDQRPLTLFQFTYDTYTRDHLEALVEEIDSLHAIPQQGQVKHDSLLEEQEPRWEGLSDAQDSEEERPIYRSSKRIRLSPTDERDERLSIKLKVPATPRSAVRDRIRDRRRATDVPLSQSQATPSRAAFSLPTATSNPTLPASSALQPIPIYLQPGTPRPEPAEANPNPVANRLLEAQAMMNRIKQQAPRGSVSSFEASSSAASASINRPYSDNSQSSRATPEVEDHSSAQSRPMPQMLRDYPASEHSGPGSTHRSTTSGSGTIKAGGSTLSSRRTVSTQLTSSYGFGRSQPAPLKESSNQFLMPPSLQPVEEVPSARDSKASSAISSHSNWSSGSQYLHPNHLKSAFDTTTNTQSQNSQVSSRSNQSQNTRQGLTTIAPQDIQHLLQPTQGKMVYDAQQNKWVKTSTRSQQSQDMPEEMELERSSDDDPFKDIESFASKPNLSEVQVDAPHSRSNRHGEEQYDDFAEAEEGSQQGEDWQGRDNRSQTDDEDGYRSQSDDGELEEQAPLELFEAANQISQNALTTPPYSPQLEEPPEMSFIQAPEVITDRHESPYISTFNSKIQPRSLSDPLATPGFNRPVVRPRSVLKTRSDPMISTPAQCEGSPAPGSIKSRSVSFSDGRIAGKIKGAPSRSASPEEQTTGRRGSALKYEIRSGNETQDETSASDATGNVSRVVSATASARTKKIADALAQLNDLEDISYTRTETQLEGRSVPERQKNIRTRPRVNASYSKSKDPFRSSGGPGNATFLTECSFGVSQDKLVQYITDVEPYEPCWEELRTVNLSGKGVDSLVRLKEFLPALDEADLSQNEITYLTGIPVTLRTLLMTSNRLTSLTSFGHLRNLERLDISNNQLDSVTQLSCLIHLRELNVDNNQISAVDGLSELDGLIELSMKGNRFTSLDMSCTKWRRLESLNLSNNKLTAFIAPESLSSCITINLDNNFIKTLDAASKMPNLRILRLCNNPLESIDITSFYNLRSLLFDDCLLSNVDNLDQLKKLENFSIRSQRKHRLQLQSHGLRDLRRLYLSGNKLPRSFPTNQYYNLVYLELAMCQLSRFPDGFAALVPNCRSLNLNHNFLEDLSPLAGMVRLRRLTVVGSRLEDKPSLNATIQMLPELEHLDLRMNPLTLAFYPPLTFVIDSSKLSPGFSYNWPNDRLSTPSEKDVAAWRLCDHQFRKILPDRWYLKRTAYRGTLMQANQNLKVIDGLDVETGIERQKLLDLLQQLQGRLKLLDV